MQAINQITVFLNAGGPVLALILLLTILLCSLIAERYRFLKFDAQIMCAAAVQAWHIRTDKSSWFALQIRTASIAQTKAALEKNLSLIGLLIALCPMLGLLGTVSGMVSVFDVMAVTGTGNAREMASGISKATLPTMAGMVISLLGLYFRSRFNAMAKHHLAHFEDSLVK
ncbi:MAG: MotA/TolQ/ExbB proton channel family protein [Oceanospirillaceae bacterium]|nr:MotA/TolQ/ExbB proton channel family protein [Oceanospirillaceae bacterium]MCP5349407.1 MotA/TolQ/ExbB proton channel family protein [Oceanospirillaceae bacterium]